MNKKYLKDVIIYGFAIFSIFFGAGNTLFPAFLGFSTSANSILSTIGFLITAVGVPLSVLIITIKFDGDYLRYYSIAGKTFAVILITVTILLLGPLIVTPRLATVSYEVGIKPFFDINPNLFSFIFFLIASIFVINKFKVIELIGKILTPLLIIFLIFFIVKSLFIQVDPNAIRQNIYENPFLNSLTEGYLTMDALGTGFLISIAWSSIKNQYAESENDLLKKIITHSSILAFTIISIVYAGFINIGSKLYPIVDKNITKAELLSFASKYILGNYGNIVLSIIIILACLTTAIGLASFGGEVFSNISKNKIDYKVGSILMLILSFFTATLGLDKIINLSIPFLLVAYPTTILITFFCFFEKYFDKRTIKFTVYAITIFNTLIEVIKFTNLNFDLNSITIISSNIDWLILSIISIVMFELIIRIRGKK